MILYKEVHQETALAIANSEAQLHQAAPETLVEIRT